MTFSGEVSLAFSSRRQTQRSSLTSCRRQAAALRRIDAFWWPAKIAAREIAMSVRDVGLVLVHGAWADGSSWAEIIRGLASDEVEVVAAPLPLTCFQDDVAALDRAVERAAGPVILVGHAYAGAVIAAARSMNVKGLIYVAAVAPDEGETVADVFYRDAPHPKAPKLCPDSRGLIYLPAEAFPDAFAQHADAETLRVLAAVQRPVSVNCINVPVPRPSWKDLPSWFLVAGQDHMIPPETQHFMAARMGARTRNAPVDHSPIVTAPELVVEIIRDAIAEVSAAGKPGR
jgi:pimeloyl-ACP methyl ester carboxylesterase